MNDYWKHKTTKQNTGEIDDLAFLIWMMLVFVFPPLAFILMIVVVLFDL